MKASTLADAIGMSKASMSVRLNEHRPFNTDELVAIADHLGVDVFTLLAPPSAVSA